MGALDGPPGAPRDAIGRDEAARRWADYRAQIWRVNAARRGQFVRATTLRLLRPGSWLFRAVTRVAEPVLVACRRRRGPLPVVSVAEFPEGAAGLATEQRRGSERDAPTMTRVVLGASDPRAADLVVRDLNGVLVGAREWIVVVDEADHVVPGALAAMADLGASRGADLVYADEVTAGGRLVARTAALGPIGLLGADRAGRVTLFRRDALARVGGFSAVADWAFRHDAVTRLVEAGATTAHYPRVAATTDESARYVGSLERATRAALGRRGVTAVVGSASEVGAVPWRATPSRRPSVAIVVPTRDRVDLLEACLRSVREHTAYPSYEVVVVDNDSVEPATRDYLSRSDARVVAAPGPFNYSAIINRGVAATDAEVIVTLNNDVTVAQDDWLDQLVAVATMPGVGVVGVRLDEPDGRPQHEGIAVAPYPQNLRRDLNYVVADAWLESTREASAVTGACQAMRREVFDELGGLDERLVVVHNDVDLCLRARRLGYSTVYLASVRLTHAEGSSRGSLTPEDDVVTFLARWDGFAGLDDPHFPEQLELIGDVVRCRGARPYS
ncbi:MAG: glycosyltransferase family 2 protein [Acidimicrobiales bacterium]